MEIRPLLVLNRSWTPIATTPIMRALSLICRGHARIVSTGDYALFDWEGWLATHSFPHEVKKEDEQDIEWINTPTIRIEAPRIVTLATFNGVPSRYLAYSRKALFRRDNNTCQYCGATPGARALTIDHVMPRSRQGGTDWHNCVVSCMRCNVRKGNRTPEEAGMKLARAPFRPSYLEALRINGEVPQDWCAFVEKPHLAKC
ncbi:MAG: HNH endonuclease [Planctomycetes bacterium]|nr:HNH endonuclease [Planctomycetota bacterium]